MSPALFGTSHSVPERVGLTHGDRGHEIERLVLPLGGETDRAGKVLTMETVVLNRRIFAPFVPNVFSDHFLIRPVSIFPTGVTSRIEQNVLPRFLPLESRVLPP